MSTAIGAISLVLGLIVSMLAFLAGPSYAVDVSDEVTCQGDEAEADVFDGAVQIGSLTWDDPDTGQVTFTALPGFEDYQVKLCISASNAVTEATLANGEASTAIINIGGQPAAVSNVKILEVIPPDPDPDPEPTVALSTDCEGTQATATVTIDNDGDDDFEVQVFIDDLLVDTISETTTFDGDAESVLRAEWGDGESDEATFEDCTEDELLLSTAAFTTGTECQASLPALTYDVTISETADDPVGDLTLTVADVDGELGTAVVSESGSGSIQLPTEAEGAAVTVSWDFDGATTQETLASDCTDVLGVTDERDPDQAAETEEEEQQLPATEVKGEQVASGELPNTGAEHVILGLLAGGFLMLGGSMLMLGDRRRRVLA